MEANHLAAGRHLRLTVTFGFLSSRVLNCLAREQTENKAFAIWASLCQGVSK